MNFGLGVRGCSVATIEIPDNQIPEGYEVSGPATKVTYRVGGGLLVVVPTCKTPQSYTDQVKAAGWTFPGWLKAEAVARDDCGEWRAHRSVPHRCNCCEWESLMGVLCLTSGGWVDFTPPPPPESGDWRDSLLRREDFISD